MLPPPLRMLLFATLMSRCFDAAIFRRARYADTALLRAMICCCCYAERHAALFYAMRFLPLRVLLFRFFAAADDAASSRIIDDAATLFCRCRHFAIDMPLRCFAPLSCRLLSYARRYCYIRCRLMLLLIFAVYGHAAAFAPLRFAATSPCQR